MSHTEKKLPKIKEYTLFYAKNACKIEVKPLKINKIENIEKFKTYSRYYSKIILNIHEVPEKWEIIPLKEYFS